MQDPLVEAASKAVKAAVDFFMPIVCVHCGTEGSLLCDECVASSLSISKNTCVKCGERSGENLKLCGDCVVLPPPLDRFLAAYRYGGPVRSAVHALKYKQTSAIAPLMASLMSEHAFVRGAKLDCVAPVPIHSIRLRERGYNQASLLARYVAGKLHLHFIEDALIKTQATQSQVNLTRQQRAMSLKNVFMANYNFDDGHVLLVDDVCTTGNTLMNCAVALKHAGARRVSAMVFAKETLETAFDNESTGV